jgi:hypothetical protein
MESEKEKNITNKEFTTRWSWLLWQKQGFNLRQDKWSAWEYAELTNSREIRDFLGISTPACSAKVRGVAKKCLIQRGSWSDVLSGWFGRKAPDWPVTMHRRIPNKRANCCRSGRSFKVKVSRKLWSNKIDQWGEENAFGSNEMLLSLLDQGLKDGCKAPGSVHLT